MNPVPGKPHISRVSLFSVGAIRLYCWQCAHGFHVGMGMSMVAAYHDWRSDHSIAEAQARGHAGLQS